MQWWGKLQLAEGRSDATADAGWKTGMAGEDAYSTVAWIIH
jgi:hypothetical protein